LEAAAAAVSCSCGRVRGELGARGRARSQGGRMRCRECRWAENGICVFCVVSLGRVKPGCSVWRDVGGNGEAWTWLSE
jgi:hypothetical protein